jgi:hypothetical protein
MKQRKMKNLIWSAAVLTVLMTSAACSSGASTNAVSKDTPSVSPSPSASMSSSPAAATPSSSPSASASQEATTATGEFGGMIDGHSIEIKKDDGTTAGYQIDPDTADKVSTWEVGTKVKFQYTGNTVTVIDKA